MLGRSFKLINVIRMTNEGHYFLSFDSYAELRPRLAKYMGYLRFGQFGFKKENGSYVLFPSMDANECLKNIKGMCEQCVLPKRGFLFIHAASGSYFSFLSEYFS
jgi:hypothetical protein